jgi:hypothetical protein
MSTYGNQDNGYRPCACRDCMETAIGEPGALCLDCEEHGCEVWPGEGNEERGTRYDCESPDAYGGYQDFDEEPDEDIDAP